MIAPAETTIAYIQNLLDGYAKKICDGSCGGGETIEGQMVNYRVAVALRRNLLRIKENIETIFAGGEIDDDGEIDSTATEQDEQK